MLYHKSVSFSSAVNSVFSGVLQVLEPSKTP
nr:MAG TPA: hypothetical protein [Caudoviricetes sp.]